MVIGRWEVGQAVRIAETFASLQGEGILAGVPSFFIRTSGCNLRCTWCDTPYASWRPEASDATVAELLVLADQAGLRHVVVTGGEPLLQRNLRELTEALADRGHHITVETAGTLAADFTCHLLSMSPKTGNSDPSGAWRARHRERRRDLAAARRLLDRFPEHQVKLVVEGEGDLPEVVDLVERLGVDRERVLLMTQGATPEELAARAPEVARLCMEHGFRYSPRLHMGLFGGGRGV